MIDETTAQFIEEQQKIVNNAQARRQISEISASQQAIAVQEQEREKGMVSEQLDLSDELMVMKHLFQGDVLKDFDDGRTKWTKPDDPNYIILTEFGVYFFMDFIQNYANKNTLLSCYTQDRIYEKMYDIGQTLNDDIYMEYEYIFKHPTFEECKSVLEKRIDSKVKLRKFALEVVGKEADEEGIKEKFLEEIEDRIQVEIEQIKEKLMKDKLKRFNVLMRKILDFIESTYNRALAGQERKSLRQHYHVSENINPMPIPQKPSKINPLSWRR
jgi:hypothetical protein